MNKISYESNKQPIRSTTVKRLLNDLSLGSCKGYAETAFIGRVGYDDDDSLYLITFDRVIKLSEPHKSWDGGADVKVQRFVDLEITVKEKYE